MPEGTGTGANAGQGSASGSQGETSSNPATGNSTGSMSQGGSQNANTGQGSNNGEANLAEIVSKLSTKLDSVLSDNAKYRQRLRALVSDDDGGEGTNGNTNKGSSSEVAELVSELRRERALNSLSAAATKAGFVTPELILNFVDLDEVTDKKGQVKDTEKVIGNLKAKYPALFGIVVEGTADGAAGAGNRNSSANQGDMNSLIRSKARGR